MNQIVEIDTNIDDMTAEQLGFVMEQLLEAGALDVYFTNIHMKKNRPGVKLSTLCSLDKQQQLIEMLLNYTSTFGVRYRILDRSILDRSFIEIEVLNDVVRCKIGKMNGKTIKIVPEYEDCKRVAKASGLPISEVFHRVMLAIDAQKHIDKA